MTVFCEMGIDNGGWTTVQRRYEGTVDFYRLWDDYKTGFGNIAGEHWLGNDNLHFILRQRSYQVRFDLEDFAGVTAYAVYSRMYVGDESANYKLNLTGYNGTAEFPIIHCHIKTDMQYDWQGDKNQIEST
ncbi:fibrinogen-like protein A [Mytilus galloprovincialis]|uniref:fibrinogen-like protein A n=1 Tax=Mytilus galloprovincialis TaxID=29158 RepID=UPI003F7BC93B